MKTLADLENKAGWRLLKVIYFILVGIALLISIFVNYGNNGLDFDNSKSYIKCNNGNIYNLKENNVHLYSENNIYSWDNEMFNNWCGVSPSAKNGYTLVYEYTSRETIMGIFWTLVVLLGLTFGLQRIVYYVYLGSFTPNKE